MRALPLLIIFLSINAFATEAVITLAPGGSALIQPGDQKLQVVCAAAGPIKCTCAKQASGKYCARYYNFTEADFYCAGPGTTSSMFVSVEDCQLAMASIPVCY